MISPTGIFILSLKWDEDRWNDFKLELTASETQKRNAKGRYSNALFSQSFVLLNKYSKGKGTP
jgi:hypothetical protein